MAEISEVKDSTPVTLTKQLIVSVIELIEFYSKKGAFKVSEFKDVASINERLTEILAVIETDKKYNELTKQEYEFIIMIFKEGSVRVAANIDSYGQLYSIYQHYQSLYQQKVAADKEQEKKKKDIPSVGEVEAAETTKL